MTLGRWIDSSFTLALKSLRMREVRDKEESAEPGAQVLDECRGLTSRLVGGRDERVKKLVD